MHDQRQRELRARVGQAGQRDLRTQRATAAGLDLGDGDPAQFGIGGGGGESDPARVRATPDAARSESPSSTSV